MQAELEGLRLELEKAKHSHDLEQHRLKSHAENTIAQVRVLCA